MNHFHGIKIIVSPDIPRYTLPESLFEGHVWPAGYREDFNAWSVATLGTTSRIEDGKMLLIPGNMFSMNQKTFAQLKQIGAVTK